MTVREVSWSTGDLPLATVQVVTADPLYCSSHVDRSYLSCVLQRAFDLCNTREVKLVYGYYVLPIYLYFHAQRHICISRFMRILVSLRFFSKLVCIYYVLPLISIFMHSGIYCM